MTHTDGQEGPEREWRLFGLVANKRLFDHDQFVDVEQDSGEVADQEDQNDSHEDHGQMVVFSAAAATTEN